MSASPTTRRAVAEINFGEGEAASFKIGNRSIHQFWHLFSSQFRYVLLAPQRRPDSGRVAWNWREAIEKRPVTAMELSEVRRRLSEGSRSLANGLAGLERDDSPASKLESQVRANVIEMVGQLIAQRDLDLSGYVCRTDAGLMLHSWGASVPAEPHYPDALAGEIGGALIVGAERPAGVVVVLENAQGAVVARVKSDKDGAFVFPPVAAGSYRVRVADRSDFPAGGLVVAMERESITGLELRAVSSESAAVAGTYPVITEEGSPWYKRRLTVVIGLLLILGIGGCLWRTARPHAQPVAAANHSSGWQSASGQLSGGEAKSEGADNRKVGNEGAWSSLSASAKIQKTTSPRDSRLSLEGQSAAGQHSSPLSDADLSNSPREDGKANLADAMSKAAPLVARQTPPKSAERTAIAPAHPSEKNLPLEDLAAVNSESEETKPAENKPATSSGKAADKKLPAALAGSLPTVDEEQRNQASSGGEETSAEKATAVAGANGSKAVKPTSAKTPAASGKSPASSPAESSADADGQDAGAAAEPDSPTDQLKASPGQKPKERVGSAAANATAANPIPEASAAVSAAGDQPDSSTPAAANTQAPGASPPKKAGSGPSASKPASVQQSPENTAESDSSAPETPPATSKPKPKSNPAVGGKAPTNAGASSAAPDSPAPAEEDQPANDQPQSTARNSPVVTKSNKAAKASVSTLSTPEANEEQPAESPAAGQPAGAERAPDIPRLTVGTAPLVQIARVRASVWKARLIQDLILPTRPVTAAEEDAVEAMREKLLKERTALMPPAFRDPRVTSGFSVDLSALPVAAGDRPSWHVEAGAPLSSATVQGDRAELAWSGASLTRDSVYILGYPDGREIARVSAGPTGVPVLKVSPGTRASYWVGIEHSLVNDAAQSGYEWRLRSGAALPTSWLRNDRWREGRGQRMDIPLDATATRIGNYGIALVDQATGWALMSDVALQSK